MLGQTYTDFELILSSNASTDGTDDICRDYAARDERITFYRQDHNVGAAPHHDFVFQKSHGELFKWASGDDLWGRELVAKCIELLDANPDAVLTHTYTAAIDGEDNVIQALEYPLHTDAPEAPERLRSQLRDADLPGAIQADDFYGVIRSDVLRKVKPHGSFYHADQVFMAELVLHGRFLQVPEWLYFRRHHDGRALQANPTISSWSRNLDPKRSQQTRASADPAGRRVHPRLLRRRTACSAERGRQARVQPPHPRLADQPSDPSPARCRAAGADPALRCDRGAVGRRPSSPVPRGADVRIGLFGRLGSGNIGNDATLEAVLAYLKAERPDADLDSLCSGPQRVTDRYGVPAAQLGWLDGVGPVRGPKPVRLAMTLGRIVAGSLIDTWRITSWVRRHDVVIVPGMGVLESTLPQRPWELPWTQFVMSLAGKLFRVKVAFVSVGANVVSERVTGWLLARSAELAYYRSFRDEQSLGAAQKMRMAGPSDHVFPDLVFALPSPPVVQLGDSVGVGVMAYSGGTEDRADAERYPGELHGRDDAVRRAPAG